MSEPIILKVIKSTPIQLVVKPNNNTGGNAEWGSITGTLSNQSDLQTALDNKQVKPIVVSANITPSNDGVYTVVASAVFTDPTPSEGKGFSVLVRNGTATVGGTAYAVAGTLVRRVFHSGAWANYVTQQDLGYTPENAANKSTNVNTDQASNTKYPSVKAVFDWVIGLGYITASALSGYATQAWVTSQGFITNVITALGFTPENVSNKKTDLTDNSDTFYPTQKAVKTAVDAKQATLVSGTNIKTINGSSVLGAGDLTVTDSSKIAKNVGATYTTNTITTVTAAEYAAIGTKDNNTLYFIV